MLGRLKPGMDMKQAQASLNVIARRMAEEHPDSDNEAKILLYPEKLSRPDPDPEHELPVAAISFSILAALVLLVACFNVANVLLVRATVSQAFTVPLGYIGAGGDFRKKITKMPRKWQSSTKRWPRNSGRAKMHWESASVGRAREALPYGRRDRTRRKKFEHSR